MSKDKKERRSLRSLRALALVAGLAVGALGAVSAYAGMWSGLPAATSSPTTASGNATTLPLTGNEVGAFDTGLSGGRNPQTETISVDQLKTYMYGNGGSASLTANSTATATAGAATCNSDRCVVTSESLTTAAGSAYQLDMSSDKILSTSIILVNVYSGTNTRTGAHLRAAGPSCSGTNCAARIIVDNVNTQALNGTLKFSVVVIN